MKENNRQNFNVCIRNLDTNKERQQINIIERKVYRRILDPVYGNEKENWRILTTKDIYAMMKKPTITETVRLSRLLTEGITICLQFNVNTVYVGTVCK